MRRVAAAACLAVMAAGNLVAQLPVPVPVMAFRLGEA